MQVNIMNDIAINRNELKKLYLQSQKNKQNYQNRAKNRKKVS